MTVYHDGARMYRNATRELSDRRAFCVPYHNLLPHDFDHADLHGDGRPGLIVWPRNGDYCESTTA